MKALKQIIPIFVLIGFVIFMMKQNSSVSSYIGGDFSIPSTKGEYKLKDDRGKVVLLYFGYRFCPDICPTTLSTLASVYSSLAKDHQEKVKLVFISVDSERDTIENLKEYVEFFNPKFIGATDTKKNIDKLVNIYGVKYEKHFPKGKEAGFYTVDHSAEAFIIGKDGEIKEIIPHAEQADLTKEKIINALKEKL